jgi:hypothetical protein
MYFVEALLEEKFEDTKGVIRSRKSQDRPYSGQDIKVIRSQQSQCCIVCPVIYGF